MGQGGQVAGSERKSAGAAAELEVQDMWDEDNMVLFLWSNTKVAVERRAQEKREHTAYLEDRRVAVTRIPDVV